jgi:hypothetical protein
LIGARGVSPLRMLRWLVLIAACHRAPAPPPTPGSGSAFTGPRCVLAGGTCVGPAAIQANPSAPCAPGLHRVDDVPAPAGRDPACLGIPTGEEACCMPDR